MPSATAMPTAPSHRVDDLDDGKVLIRDLELFVGFDPTIDDPADAKLAKWTPQRVHEVITRTTSFMARGQNPKLVRLHGSDENCTPEAVGDIVAIRGKKIGGGSGICGDVVMSRDDFESLLATNRYPRRSAEIWGDGFMSEVALLGRQTPRRPLPDTRFGREEMGVGGMGPGSVSVPSFDGKKKDDEKDENELPSPSAGQSESDFVEVCMSNERMQAEYPNKDQRAAVCYRQFRKTHNMRSEHFARVPEDHRMAEQTNADLQAELDALKEENARLQADKDKDTGAEAREQFAREMQELRDQNKELAERTRRAEFGRELDRMESEGYQLGDHREMMERELSTCESNDDAAAKFKFWRSIMSKRPERVDLSRGYGEFNRAGATKDGDPPTASEDGRPYFGDLPLPVRKICCERARDATIGQGQQAYANALREEYAKARSGDDFEIEAAKQNPQALAGERFSRGAWELYNEAEQMTR